MALVTLFEGSTKLTVNTTTTATASSVGTLHLNDSIPAVKSYQVFIYNNTNAPITVMPVVAPVNIGSKFFINLQTTASSISAGDKLVLSYNYDNTPAPYFTVNITLPPNTKGEIEGFYNVNYNYTVT